MIWNVAVPRPQHSPMLGQRASSHTVCRPPSRMSPRSSPKRPFGDGARTVIQSGRAFCSSDHGMRRLRQEIELEVERLGERAQERPAHVGRW